MLIHNEAAAAGTAHGLSVSDVSTACSPDSTAALIAKLTDRGHSKTQVARQIGVNPSQVTRIAKGEQQASKRTHEAIERLLADSAKIADIEAATATVATPATVAPTAAPNDRTQRLAEAERFLAALDTEAEQWTFQTFDDSGQRRGKLARTVHGELSAVFEQLDRLNNAGAGVFVTVNETDGQGRKAENVTRVRAVFADFDPPKTKAAPASYPVEPVIEVESSPGKRHVYWTVDDQALEGFEDQQRGIVAALGSDPAPIDLPRVMRLPGFRHMKDPSKPHWVQIISAEQRLPYQAADLARAFPPVAKVNGTSKAPGERDTHHPHDAVLRGESFFAKVNNKALVSLAAWVPALFPAAKPYQDGYRVSSADLGRKHQEDISILPHGSRDFGEERGASPITLVIEWGPANDAKSAAFWLCQQIGIDPSALGWQDGPQGAGSAEHGAQVAAALGIGQDTHQWPDLYPLVNITEPQPYPLDALPQTIQAAVNEVQRFAQAPLPMVASSALSALSLAIQGHVDVARASKLQGPISLYQLVIADSGERKSTVDGFFTAAVREYERQEAEAAKPLQERFEAETASWQAEKDGVLQAVKQAAKSGKPTRDLKLSLAAIEHEKPEAPRVPKLLRGDDTPENLAYRLAREWPSAGVVSSEAAVIFGSHGMSDKSVARNLGLLNILWDGGTLDIGRRTSESFTVRGARFTSGLMVQEAVLRDFNEKAGALARGSGYWARFLVCWPASTQGTRLFREPPEQWPALASFNRRLSALLQADAPITDDGSLEPHLLQLTPEAKALWVQFHDAIEGQLAPEGDLYDVRDVASKVADNAARLAALLQVFSQGVVDIDAEMMESGCRLAAWHLSEAQRFFGELAIPADTLKAMQLERWLLAHCRQHQTTEVARRVVQRLITPSALREGGRLDVAIGVLADHGRVREVTGGKRKVIEVRPELMS